MKKPVWIKESEALDILGLSKKTLRQYCRERKIPIVYAKLNRSTFLYDRTSIEQYILSKSNLLRG